VSPAAKQLWETAHIREWSVETVIAWNKAAALGMDWEVLQREQVTGAMMLKISEISDLQLARAALEELGLLLKVTRTRVLALILQGVTWYGDRYSSSVFGL
jgi:hypothetical protein